MKRREECLSSNVVAYLGGFLESQEAEAFEKHLSECSDCCLRLEEEAQLELAIHRIGSSVQLQSEEKAGPKTQIVSPDFSRGRMVQKAAVGLAVAAGVVLAVLSQEVPEETAPSLVAVSDGEKKVLEEELLTQNQEAQTMVVAEIPSSFDEASERFEKLDVADEGMANQSNVLLGESEAGLSLGDVVAPSANTTVERLAYSSSRSGMPLSFRAERGRRIRVGVQEPLNKNMPGKKARDL